MMKEFKHFGELSL